MINWAVNYPSWLEPIIFWSFIIYLMFALHNFYGGSLKKAFLKAHFISFSYILFIVTITIAGIIIVSFLAH